MSQTRQQEVQEQRDEILNASVENLRAYSEWFAALNEDGINCVHGNKNRVEKASALFERIETLEGAGGDEDEDDEEDEDEMD